MSSEPTTAPGTARAPLSLVGLATATETSRDTGPTVRTDYAFPAVRPVPHPEKHLVDLMGIYTRSRRYSDIREHFCAASIALNTAGLWAPAFREQPTPRPKAAGKGPEDLQLHRDRVVIDMHWLWARRSPVGTAKPPYSMLLNGDSVFDFDLASAFAAENWTSHERATEKFSLSYTVQWQLATVKSAQHAEEHRIILDGGRHEGKRVASRSSTVGAAIADWAELNHRIRGHERVHLNLWVAREMLGSYKSAERIGQLAGLMAGTPALERSTVRRKLEALDRRLSR